MSWPKVKFKEVAEVITGSTPPTDDKENYGSDVPFVTPGDLEKANNGSIVYKANTYLSEKGVKEARLIPKDTVMVCCIASLGKVGIAGTDVVTNQQINSLVFDKGKVFPKFGYYYCLTLKDILKNMAPATTVPIVNKSRFSDITIPLPPLDVQKKIATVLDKADSLGQKRREAIKKLDQLVQSVFLEMFGDPVTNPKGWNKVSMSQVTKIDATMVNSKLEEFKCLLHIGGEHIEKNTGRLFPIVTAEEDGLISNNYLFNEHHVLYCKIRPYLRKVVVPKFRGLCSSDIYPVTPLNGKLSTYYLWFTLLSEDFTKYAESKTSGTNIPRINRSQFNNYMIMLPPFELQKQFDEAVLKIKTLGRKYDLYTDKLDTLFNSLIQRAFRGDLSFNDRAFTDMEEALTVKE